MTETLQFHINPNGFVPARCYAAENCRWVSENERHYATFDECRLAIEDLFVQSKWVRLHKRSVGHQHVMEYLAPVC